VDGIVTKSDLDDLIKDGAEVHTTIFDFGEAVIKRLVKGDLSILTITGVYSRALGKEIERLGLQWRGNLGIEFKEIKVNPSMRKRFDSSIVGVLKTIRERYRSRDRLLILCTPPSELLDLLKLTGVHTGYQIIEDPASFVLKTNTPAPPEPRASRDGGALQRSGVIQKRILQLNQSLNRTVSLEKGLDSAAKCVKRFLPQAPPEAAGYRFAFSYKSSEKVGGDFFDFIPLGGDAVGLVIGDVSGHGLDAAFLMGITKKVIRIRAAGSKLPAPYQVLCEANADLVSDFNRYTFATALYGILDLPTGYFTFARAGHEVPLLFGPHRPAIAVESKGIPLAVDTGKNFCHMLEEKTIQIQRGEFLLLSTDGLAECWNVRGASYTRERLKYSLNQVDPTTTADALLNDLLDGITEFTGGRPHEDDMTAILVQRLA
jgi:serine phosphatase RsbU (regulator of sigma subunit)/ABC-type transporter Mla MlaB component